MLRLSLLVAALPFAIGCGRTQVDLPGPVVAEDAGVDAGSRPDAGGVDAGPPARCFDGDVVLATEPADTEMVTLGLVEWRAGWVALYRTRRPFGVDSVFAAFVSSEGPVRFTQDLTWGDAALLIARPVALRSPGGSWAIVSTVTWELFEAEGDELVHRPPLEAGHIGHPPLAVDARLDRIHVLSWYPDGTGAGTYRTRSAVVELGDDGRLHARSRFVAPGLDVPLHYAGGGFLYGDHLYILDLEQVFVDGSRSWNVIGAELGTDSPGAELPWEPLGSRLVENGPDHYLGFVDDLDRAVTWRWDRSPPVVGSTVALEPLPAPGAAERVTLLDGGVPGMVPFPRMVRDERFLAIATGSGAHAFALPDGALLAETDLRFPEIVLSESRMLGLGVEARPGEPTAAIVLRCLELR